MKIELIRDGDVYRIKGNKGNKLPDRLTLEIPADCLEEQLKGFDGKVNEIWSPMFPPGIGAEIEKELSRKSKHGGKRVKG